jgi:site-specific DNA-methyltransferase (adenine-specific)
MNKSEDKIRAGRNRTLILTDTERTMLRKHLIELSRQGKLETPPVGTIHGDCFQVIEKLPLAFVDLLILDPPYNLTKRFTGLTVKQVSVPEYTQWLDMVITALKPTLHSTASVYICGDWLTSTSIYEVASRHFHVQNRITWEREKGRGARANWKNCSEDIWFCTVNKADYTFHADAVRLRRRVLAPYRQNDGSPKDWLETEDGNFRDTAPSNLWTDITIPFWSMPENTDHPTQKSEKLLAKLILASSNEGDFVFDPFLGSGTTTVTAKKLGRRYLGIDSNEDYCLLAEKRLDQANLDNSIQGYTDGVFWERNSLSQQALKRVSKNTQP